MRVPVQSLLVAAMVAVIANPQWFAFLGSEPRAYYLAATAALLALVGGQLAAVHSLRTSTPALFHRSRRVLLPLFVAALVLLGIRMVVMWVSAFRSVPLDPMSADMLPLLNAAGRRFIAGHNPYTIYHDAAPWPLPLVYGPPLWMPYGITAGLGVDPRYLTTFCMALTASLFLIQAYLRARRGRYVDAIVLAALPLAVLAGKPLLRFMPIGHTQVYWPLLAGLCLALDRDALAAAAVLVGLLVAARATMASIVPMFLVYAFKQRPSQFVKNVTYVAAAALLPFVPFAALDHKMLYQSMVMNYVTVIKPMIWSEPGTLDRTFGVTAYLVRHNLGGLLSACQAVVTGAVCVGALVLLKAREQVMVWMGLSLTVFSMTLFWPVRYVYYDVLVLLALAATVRPLPTPDRVRTPVLCQNLDLVP